MLNFYIMYQLIKSLFNVPSANQIINNIWIGDADSSQDIQFLKSNKISVIINCTRDLPFVNCEFVRYCYRVPVYDNKQKGEIIAMSNYLSEIVQIINYHYQKGHRILIHCRAGIQRSACVFLVYHVQYHSKNFDKTLQLMKSKRPWVFLAGINFQEAINIYFQKYNQSKI